MQIFYYCMTLCQIEFRLRNLYGGYFSKWIDLTKLRSSVMFEGYIGLFDLNRNLIG